MSVVGTLQNQLEALILDCQVSDTRERWELESGMRGNRFESQARIRSFGRAERPNMPEQQGDGTPNAITNCLRALACLNEMGELLFPLEASSDDNGGV